MIDIQGKVVPAQLLHTALDRVRALIDGKSSVIHIADLEWALGRAYTPIACCTNCGATVDAQPSSERKVRR